MRHKIKSNRRISNEIYHCRQETPFLYPGKRPHSYSSSDRSYHHDSSATVEGASLTSHHHQSILARASVCFCPFIVLYIHHLAAYHASSPSVNHQHCPKTVRSYKTPVNTGQWEASLIDCTVRSYPET
uniref:Uncharacterized protein n=1 Tax=Photinus pyralis TaxID=7054 RepID=A0A1Y1LNH0_PHOPY